MNALDQNAVVSDDDYKTLLSFRDGIRRFTNWSESQAKAVGLTHMQHQLLLTIKGHGSPPTISEVAEHLLLRHNSVVELVDRAINVKLVRRTTDRDDQRIVRLSITKHGLRVLQRLTHTHLEEISRIQPELKALLNDFQ